MEIFQRGLLLNVVKTSLTNLKVIKVPPFNKHVATGKKPKN